ncbi:MAG: hypothetical protein NDJ90_11670 [Oligoflexia bacterium]|nr:hypothetical protein [Oligoflexia bacterium]
MKSFFSLTALVGALVFGQVALADSSAKTYRNSNPTTGTPSYLLSMKLDSQPCGGFGYQVTFEHADPLNFCRGWSETSRREWKVCVGREVGDFPFPKRCIGYKKRIAEVETVQVTYDESSDTLVRNKQTVRNDELVFEESYELQARGADFHLTYAFMSSGSDGLRKGIQQYTYVLAE